MVADAQREFRGQDGVPQGVLEARLVDPLRPVAQAEGGKQAPFYRFFNGEGLVFDNGPDEVIVIQPAPGPPAAEVQQGLEVGQGMVQALAAGAAVEVKFPAALGKARS